MNTNKQMVEQVIEDYIRGTYEGDTDILKKIFHPKAQMVGSILGEAHYGTVQPFYDVLTENPSMASLGTNYHANIKTIDIVDTIATVVLEEKDLMDLDFTNYFHLILEHKSWLIVSKTYIGLQG